MRVNKLWIILLLVLALAIAACGGSDEEVSEPEDTAEEEAAVEEEAEAPAEEEAVEAPLKVAFVFRAGSKLPMGLPLSTWRPSAIWAGPMLTSRHA